MITRELLIPRKTEITTVDDIEEYLDTVLGILVYSGKDFVGNIFFDSSESPTRSPTSWYFLPGMDFLNRECYDSLEDLLACINVNNINIKVLYDE